MRKMFSLIAVMLFLSTSSLNANAVNSLKVFETNKPPCAIYAEWIGYLFTQNGLNYYEGYFGAYADCVEKLYIN